MKKFLFLSIMLYLVGATTADAQFRSRIRIRGGGYWQRTVPPPPSRRHYDNRQNYSRQNQKHPAFQPTVNVSLGYGFPNLDRDQFVNFTNAYKGNVLNQTGPFTGAFDYQFSRTTSIGVMGTYGRVTMPYYNINSSSFSQPVITGKLENWSIMLNLVNYLSDNSKVSPYLRTAVGLNNWKQEYVDDQGNKNTSIEKPSQLAYQASLGAKFNLSKNAGIFMEAGYGKYIVSGGLAFKF